VGQEDRKVGFTAEGAERKKRIGQDDRMERIRDQIRTSFLLLIL
jgi:hypothetical protein